jgi:hypothetical protein
MSSTQQKLQPNVEEALDYLDFLLFQRALRKEYVELRFLNPKPLFYSQMKAFQQKHENIIVKNNCQVFLKNVDEAKVLFEHNNNFFLSGFANVYYGVNPRTMPSNKEIDGSYRCVKDFLNFYIDIDSVNKIKREDEEWRRLLHSIEFHFLKPMGIEHVVIIDSGSGMHILCRVERTKITDAKKRFMSEVVKSIHSKYATHNSIYYNKNISIDTLHDGTRILGLPGSIHPKYNKVIKIKKFEKGINTAFRIRGVKKKAINKALKEAYSEHTNNYITLPLSKSLEWQTLIRVPPQGERHSTLIFATKLLLKAKGIDDVRPLEEALQQIYGGSIDLNPYKGTEGKEYSIGIIINYLKRHSEWLETEPELKELFHNTIKNR